MNPNLPEHPLLGRHLSAAVMGGTDVAVLAEDRSWLRRGRALAALLPSLDGVRSLSDLLERPPEGVSAPEVMALLHQMAAAGWLTEGEAGTTPASNEQAFRDALQVRAPTGTVRIRDTHGGTAAGILAEALARAGVGTAEADSELTLVVTDHYLQPALTRLNAAALEAGTPWMLCKLVGQTLWIGPVFHPGRTACLLCLQERLRANRRVEDFVARTAGHPTAPVAGTLPVLERAGAAWAAQEIALWLGKRTDRLEGCMLSIRFGRGGLETGTHKVVRLPHCAACGRPDTRRSAAPIHVEDFAMPYLDGGARRTERPDVTWERLEHHISPICGAVTWVAESQRDPENLLHGFNAGHPIPLGPDTSAWLRRSVRAHASGKGTSAVQARTGALCEALERVCGSVRASVSFRNATLLDLGDAGVDPRTCLNVSDRQYDERDAINAAYANEPAELVPHRFSERLAIDWVPVWSLSRQRERFLPAALCCFGHPDVDRHFFCAAEASGCAAGASLGEAIVHGFLELVERDSSAIWWYNRARRPGVDLDSFADPFLERVQARLARDGRAFWVLDISADLGVPVMAAVSRRIDGGPTEDLLVGFGADFDAAVALRHAVTELIQFLPAVAEREADGRTRYKWPDPAGIRFWSRETLASQPQLAPDTDATPRRRTDFPDLSGPSPTADLATCLEIARLNQLEILVLDQSRPEIELAVARVVVPGLRQFWRRLGPGRLYDVPVALGWRGGATAEADMNPVSIFF